MNKKSGLTLIEMALTMTLLAIIMMALFQMSQMQHHVCRRLQHNATAILLLESVRNQIRYELSQGTKPGEIAVESLRALAKDSEWEIKLQLKNSGAEVAYMVVSLTNRHGGRYAVCYETEVTVR